MGNALGTPHVAYMGLDGGMDHWEVHGMIPVGNALGFHGLALGMLIGHTMEVLYG